MMVGPRSTPGGALSAGFPHPACQQWKASCCNGVCLANSATVCMLAKFTTLQAQASREKLSVRRIVERVTKILASSECARYLT